MIGLRKRDRFTLEDLVLETDLPAADGDEDEVEAALAAMEEGIE